MELTQVTEEYADENFDEPNGHACLYVYGAELHIDLTLPDKPENVLEVINGLVEFLRFALIQELTNANFGQSSVN